MEVIANSCKDAKDGWIGSGRMYDSTEIPMLTSAMTSKRTANLNEENLNLNIATRENSNLFSSIGPREKNMDVMNIFRKKHAVTAVTKSRPAQPMKNLKIALNNGL